MNALLNLPPEVLVKSILPLLGWNDLLRLRRTCKTAKNLVDDHVTKHPELAPELEINENEKTILAFMELGTPTRKVFLNNASGSQFYTEAMETAARFLAEYGPTVTHLRVAQLPAYCTEEEKQFLGSFVNLEAFKANEFLLNRYLKRKKPNTVGATDLPTGVFEHVRSLKLGPAEEGFNIWTLAQIPTKFSSLERICIDLHIDRRKRYLLEYLFGFYEHLVQQKRGVLKVIDFSGVQCSDNSSFSWVSEDTRAKFNQLCRISVAHNVRLVGVEEKWFRLSERLRLDEPNTEFAPILGTPVASLTSDSFPRESGALLRLDWSNLEKLEIRKSSPINWQAAEGDLRRIPCNLPKLKSLSFQVDSVIGAAMTCKWLFDGVTHENLTDMRVCIVTKRNVDIVSTLANYLSEPTCPKLKRLTFENMRASPSVVGLVRLWQIMGASLEELTFVCCPGLEDSHFVGPDADNPALIKLTNVKKLALAGLDSTPGISDALFQKVISRMKLTHLTLSSERPINKVTLAGVESMLEGPFAESIAKFPFHGWSLEGVSPEEFQASGNRFRRLSVY